MGYRCSSIYTSVVLSSQFITGALINLNPKFESFEWTMVYQIPVYNPNNYQLAAVF